MPNLDLVPIILIPQHVVSIRAHYCCRFFLDPATGKLMNSLYKRLPGIYIYIYQISIPRFNIRVFFQDKNESNYFTRTRQPAGRDDSISVKRVSPPIDEYKQLDSVQLPANRGAVGARPRAPEASEGAILTGRAEPQASSARVRHRAASNKTP